jgi:elongation factor Ts
MVKDLREKTGAGMMDCKKALTETSGDMEAAVDYLRQKGLAAAAKKASRIAAEGIVAAQVSGNVGALVEVNCETDFVAKNDDFRNFVNDVTNHLLKNDAKDLESLKNQKIGNLTIQEKIQELTLKIGEKIDLRRFSRKVVTENCRLGHYVHSGKIGVLVNVKSDNAAVLKNDEFNELLNDLCLHVAAADPKFLNGSDIDDDFKKREAAIYEAQLREQGKSDAMIPNIVQGKLAKLASEVCLLEQKFVKDPDISIAKLVSNVGSKLGAKLTLDFFERISLGEGIEKKQDNLAEEVAKLSQGN